MAFAAQDVTPGDIKLPTDTRTLRNGRLIATATFGSEPGGSINIQDAQFIEIQASLLSRSTVDRENGEDARAFWF